jgi:hypothetical protein
LSPVVHAALKWCSLCLFSAFVGKELLSCVRKMPRSKRLASCVMN